MSKAEKEFVDEINRLKEALTRTKSEYLKADYTKAIKKMEKEIAEYRRYMYG